MGLLQQLALPNAVKTIVTLLICLCLIRLSAADWPHWLGPKGNGVSTESR